jgi:hypothetical protein
LYVQLRVIYPEVLRVERQGTSAGLPVDTGIISRKKASAEQSSCQVLNLRKSDQ